VLGRIVDRLQGGGIDVYLVRVGRAVRVLLRRDGLLDRLGEDRLWHSISAGVRTAKKAAAAQDREETDVEIGEEELAIEDDSIDGDPIEEDWPDEHITTPHRTEEDDVDVDYPWRRPRPRAGEERDWVTEDGANDGANEVAGEGAEVSGWDRG